MKTLKTIALTTLLGATALGFSLPAHADNVNTSASGAGASAGSSVGAGANAQMNDDAATTATTNSGVLAPNAVNNQSREGGSTAQDNYANSSTPNSQVLSTKDSSSSDSVPRSGTENNTGQLAADNSGGAADKPAEYMVEMNHGQLQTSQISSIQQSLKNQGYNLGRVDGIWGPRTAKALRDYQSKNNLNATGEFDANTASSMNIRIEPASGGSMNGNSPAGESDNGSGTQY